MKQTLRIAIPLVVLVTVVFAVTYFSQYTRTVEEEKQSKSPEPPLRFGSSIRLWNPAGSLQDQAFPGFYERQGDAAGPKNTAGFWFENRNNSSVTMRLKGVSCTSCSGGRLAVLPPAVTRDIIQSAVLQGLPQGLASALPLAIVGPAAELDPARGLLQWQQYNFRDSPNATFGVPPANNPDGWTPQWGILELMFSVGELGPKSIKADFDVQIDATRQFSTFEFQLAFEGVDPFGVSTREIKVGEIRETTRPQQHEIVVYSSTRGPGSALGDLAEPVVSVDMPSGVTGEPGPFVTVGKPVRIPETELIPMTIALSEAEKRPVRFRAGYRLPVTVNPQIGDKKIDLGPLERVISVTVPNTIATRTVAVNGVVRGGVWLDDDRRELRVSHAYSRAATETYRIVTEKPDADVELVPAACEPDFLKVSLEKLPPAADRGYYALKLVVPAESKRGPWSGMVVLRLKGPSPQQIRIPVHGKGQ